MDEHAPQASAKAARLFTSRTYPIHYLVIPKCGCTFVKNLLWGMEHGGQHHQPLRIHDSDDRFLRADALGLTDAQIRGRAHVFTVLRNPVDRFYSLYTDKVMGPGHRKFIRLRDVLVKGYGLNVDAATVEAHRANCQIMLNWLASNLRDEQELPNDAHWTPQAYRKNIMKTFDLKLLLLNDLNAQLKLLLGDLVPDLDARLKAPERNATKAQFTRGDVLDEGLRKQINEVYAADRRLFNQTRKAWQAVDMSGSTDQIPRFSQIT